MTLVYLLQNDTVIKNDFQNLEWEEKKVQGQTDDLPRLLVEDYFKGLKVIFNSTRIGTLLLKKQVISEPKLQEALSVQKKQGGRLGDALVKTGTLKDSDINNAIKVQSEIRRGYISKYFQKTSRLGKILTQSGIITKKQLKRALAYQKKSRKLLGEILVEMNFVSRRTLKKFLEIQKETRKVLVVATLMACLAGCASAGVGMTNMAPASRDYNYRGIPTTVTPYDSKYRRVEEYLKTAYNFQYKSEKRGSDYWQLPDETEALKTGDCEDKAIWLYSKLLDDGLPNVRLVIGKENKDSEEFHAWVAWDRGGKIYILDPTADSHIWRLDQYPQGYYLPYYSFYKNKEWIHTTRTG